MPMNTIFWQEYLLNLLCSCYQNRLVQRLWIWQTALQNHGIVHRRIHPSVHLFRCNPLLVLFLKLVYAVALLDISR